MKPTAVLFLALIGAAAAVAVLSLGGCAAPQNPPVIAEPAWVNKDVERLARRACFDCHSNETQWPVYATWPIVSALVQHDVNAGRAALNFSEWTRPQEESDDIGEVVRDGEMPMAIYLPMHPEARLTAAERELLARGLERTIATDPPPGADTGADADADED